MAQTTQTTNTSTTQATQQSTCNCQNNDYLPTYPGVPPCPPPFPNPPYPPYPYPPMPCPPEPPAGCTTNNTQYYHLPLWKASDVTSWLVQMNGAMIKIDSILHNLALRTGINGLPDDLTNAVSQLCQDVNVMKCQIQDLANEGATNKLLIQNMNTQIGAISTDLSSLQLTATNLDTRIMTVESANKQNQNSITLIKSDLNMLSSSVQSLTSAFNSFQDSVNTSITGMQTQINENIDDIAELQKIGSVISRATLTSSIAEVTTGNIDNVTFNNGVMVLYYMGNKKANMTVRLPDIYGDVTDGTDNAITIKYNMAGIIPENLISQYDYVFKVQPIIISNNGVNHLFKCTVSFNTTENTIQQVIHTNNNNFGATGSSVSGESIYLDTVANLPNNWETLVSNVKQYVPDTQASTEDN